MSFAHVELPFNASPRLVLQTAIAKQLIDPRPLGGDQQALNVVAKLTMRSAGISAFILVSYML